MVPSRDNAPSSRGTPEVSQINHLSAVVITCLALVFLYVVWSDEVYMELGVPIRYEQILDVILTTLIVFALCYVWGVL
jgi:hypothetical protein